MIYLLDSNIITKFQDAGQLPALCQAAEGVRIHVVEEVRDELTRVREGDHPGIQAKKRFAGDHLREGGPIITTELYPETPESELLAKLRTGKTSARNLGEAASIAFARYCNDVVFVCGDKNGVLGALNELHGTGERVLRPHVFLRRLADQRLLAAPVVRACAPTFKNFGILPSWWEEWLASL